MTTPDTGSTTPGAGPALPERVEAVLASFADACGAAFGRDLVAVVLHGSGAEGRLRATSDVNVMVVLRAFDSSRAAEVRAPLRAAEAAVRLSVTFVLESELPLMAETFAMKMDDLRRRRRVLAGGDPFATLVIPRDALLARVRQVLLDVAMRLRHAYVGRGSREEELARAAARAAGPLRQGALILLEIEGGTALSGRAALERLAAEEGHAGLPAKLTAARERGLLPPGEAGPLVLGLSDLAFRLRERAGRA